MPEEIKKNDKLAEWRGFVKSELEYIHKFIENIPCAEHTKQIQCLTQKMGIIGDVGKWVVRIIAVIFAALGIKYFVNHGM